MKNIRKWLLTGIPFILGFIGLVIIEHEPLLDSLYRCISMYILNYSDSPANIFIEIARWTAPLATASSILMVIATVRNKLHATVRNIKGDSIAIYGPDDIRNEFIAKLGSRAVNGGDNWEFIPAKNYLLLGDETDNFSFYFQNHDNLSDKTVYLQTSSLDRQTISEPNLRLFCPEETAARIFWKEYSPFELSIACKHQLKIIFIGFANLGEHLLSYALQDNIFDPQQTIEYHIFADPNGFDKIHTGLKDIDDPVIFHNEPWYENISLLEEAQMVVVLEQTEQLALLQKLLLATTTTIFTVFAPNGIQKELLNNDRVNYFPWEKQGWDMDNIFSEKLYERAKRINLHYAHLYSGTVENDENKEKEWQKLDGFTRYSNVSSADYHEIQLHMLKVLGWPTNIKQLTPKQLELLSELEHIRWCRYHYLNNWQYGIPANGKRKDPSKRIHSDLVTYEALTEPEKQKDRDNIDVLFSIPDEL